MAVAFRNNSTTRAYNSGYTISRPSGCQTGDVLLLFCFAPYGSAGISESSGMTPSNGWTPLMPHGNYFDSGVTSWVFAWYRRITNITNEPTSYSINIWDQNQNYHSFYLAAYSGVDPAASPPVQGSSGYGQRSSSFWGEYTAGAGGSMAVFLGGAKASTSIDQPGGSIVQRYQAEFGGSFGSLIHCDYAMQDSANGFFSFGIGANTANVSQTVVIGPPVNNPPLTPSITTPATGATLNRGITQRFAWTFTDDAWDNQSKYDFRYKLTSSSTWTTVTGFTPNRFRDVAGGTFAAGSNEVQVRVYDQSGAASAWSASKTFTAADPPAGPTITSPANNATVNTTHTVMWSTSSQESYQVRTVADLAGSPDTATIYSDTGEIVSESTRSRSVSFPVNSRFEHVQVRVKSSGLWSDYSSVRIQVAYTPPATPTCILDTATVDGAIRITSSRPAPSGGQPSVTHFEVHRREAGDTGDGIRRALGVAPAGEFVDYFVASGTDYEYRVKDVGDNGSVSYSAWV